ncbi:hypothetical protein SCYAM73S_07581 [Streptomyces cyaneofuscatus]
MLIDPEEGLPLLGELAWPPPRPRHISRSTVSFRAAVP